MATKIQLRRDLDTNWSSVNPTLSQGEPGFETNTGKFKIGNGSAAWNSLPYATTSSGGSGIALTDLSVTDSGGDGSLSYNSTTGVFTYTGPSATEVRSHFTAGTGISISGGVISATGSGGTTYGISAETATGGVNLRLTGSDASTDDVKLAAGSNITLTRTDANTITIDSSGSGSGTVTSVAGTGTVNGLTLSGTVTSSGSLTLGGTLSGIDNSALTNSSITINGTAVSLGGTGTINLADLGTVSISSPSNGQVLKYNGTAWVNGTDSTGSGGSGIALTDLSATTASGITYNNTTGVFALASIPNTSLSNSSVTFNGKAASLGGTNTIDLSDLGTVTITSPSSGQVLKYNGTAWVNDTDSTGGGSGTTYGISAETATGGVNLRLTGSDASTDDVKLAAGSNVTVTRTDANTITIAATGGGGDLDFGTIVSPEGFTLDLGTI